MDIEYWEKYYKDRKQPFPHSNFSGFVASYLSEGDSLVDCGCGNARDSVYFSKIGINVTAIDQCPSLIDDLRKTIDNVGFSVADFTRLDGSTKWDCVYSRFTLHSIPEDQEDDFIKSCNSCCKKFVFIEARSDKNDCEDKSTHYRRNINLAKLIGKLSADFDILYSEESNHFSPLLDIYSTEDKKEPFLLRVVARKK
jgi:tellurite methyltransferase